MCAVLFAVAFALVQVLSALWIYGKFPRRAAPSWLGWVHRISARLAFLVGYHRAPTARAFRDALQCAHERGIVHRRLTASAARLLEYARRFGFEQQILLRLPHPPLEGVRLARVVSLHRRRPRDTVRVHRPDEHHPLDALGDGARRHLGEDGGRIDSSKRTDCGEGEGTDRHQRHERDVETAAPR